MTRIAQRPVRVPPHIARAAIARAHIGARNTTVLGSIKLFPHQSDAVRRLRRALRELHVALLADDVGLGKTYVALALAREYPSVHIVVPAALRPMWRAAIERTGTTGVELHSLQQFSRASTARVVIATDALIIVDEAHHLRTAATRRYRTIADMVAGRDLLLLSATPIHNAPADLRSVLALATSASSRELSPDLLSRVVVRRSAADTTTVRRPQVRTHAPLPVPHDPALLEAILSLPAPLPAHDGAVAGALIRLGLLRAWCSSDAALTHSLRRRLMRGEGLRHALATGRHPSNAELHSWIVGNNDVQLAFPELMATAQVETGPLLAVLDRHLSAVRALVERHNGNRDADAERVRTIREIAKTHSGTPIIAFSQFAETVRSIGRALTDIAGVGVMTGQQVRIASGAIGRQEALAYFAPDAQGRPPPPPHQRIHLLLSTDLLAEGVNLQDAGVVVHLDLPWTDALRKQRVGRLARVGSPHEVIHVYQIEPPSGAELALRLHHRLRAKAALARRFVGAPSATAPMTATTMMRRRARARVRDSVADSATAIRARIEAWQSPDVVLSTLLERDTHVPVACVRTAMPGFLAVVGRVPPSQSAHDHDEATTTLLGGVWRSTMSGTQRLVVHTRPDRIRSLVDAANSDITRPVRAASWRVVCRAIARWHRHEQMRAGIGRLDETSTREHARTRAAISRLYARTSATDRVRRRSDYLRAIAMIDRVRGAGAERALQAWGHEARAVVSAPSFAEWLSAWQQFPALCVPEAETTTLESALYLYGVLILETSV